MLTLMLLVIVHADLVVFEMQFQGSEEQCAIWSRYWI